MVHYPHNLNLLQHYEALDSKRRHHNEMERERRNNLKACFQTLKFSIPLANSKVSRAHLLSKSIEYINFLKLFHQRLEEYLQRFEENLQLLETYDRLGCPDREAERACLDVIEEISSVDLESFFDLYNGFVLFQKESFENSAKRPRSESSSDFCLDDSFDGFTSTFEDVPFEDDEDTRALNYLLNL